MADAWPWLAVAGLGALHGLNPATGWPLVAARRLHAPGRARALRALLPIAAGHLAAVALVAATVALGRSMDGASLQALAGGLLLVVVLRHRSARAGHHGGGPTRPAALALWSFIVSTGHGAGWMLVPALLPLCGGDTAARELTASGPLALALAVVGVHAAALLAVTGAMAAVACRVSRAGHRLLATTREEP